MFILNILKRFFNFFIKIIFKFIYIGLNKFYMFIIIYLSILLTCNFILQDIKNRINRLEIKRKKILIDISNNEAKISEKIINIINTNKGTPIKPSQIKKIKKIENKNLSIFQKFLIFCKIKKESDYL